MSVDESPRANAQWNTSDRTKTSTSKFVATRSTTIDGIEVRAGVTRIAAGHRWLTETSRVFEPVASTGGKAAIRAAEGVGQTRTKRYSWEL